MGVNIDTSGVTVFHECAVDPAVPDTLTHLTVLFPEQDLTKWVRVSGTAGSTVHS